MCSRLADDVAQLYHEPEGNPPFQVIYLGTGGCRRSEHRNVMKYLAPLPVLLAIPGASAAGRSGPT